MPHTEITSDDITVLVLQERGEEEHVEFSRQGNQKDITKNLTKIVTNAYSGHQKYIVLLYFFSKFEKN